MKELLYTGLLQNKLQEVGTIAIEMWQTLPYELQTNIQTSERQERGVLLDSRESQPMESPHVKEEDSLWEYWLRLRVGESSVM